MTKILFLDIDGPLIPGRAFIAAGKTEIVPFEVSDFDPIAVNLINRACKEYGWKIVLHSSWIKLVGGHRTHVHCLKQGLLDDYFHNDAFCNEAESWRYNRIAQWLDRHPEVTEYVIVDDTEYSPDVNGQNHPEGIEKHVMLIDFYNGFLMENYQQLARIWSVS